MLAMHRKLVGGLLAVAAVWAGCRTDSDCQLNGVCAEQQCDCDAAWRGPSCQEMALDGDGALAYGGPESGLTSWGGGPPVLDPVHGWTLFVTEIAGHCGLSEWSHQSTVVRATSGSPMGPFVRQQVAIGAQAHNPYYAYDRQTRSHVLFHIGDGHPRGSLRKCTNGTTPPSSGHGSRVAQRAAMGSGCPGCVSPCGSYVHYSSSLAGPWRSVSVPFNRANRTSHGSGFVMDNPAPYIFANGTTLVLFRKINSCAASTPPSCDAALTEIWLARATSFKGPYEVVGDGPITRSTRAEDPTIWRDHRGHFHAIFHGPGHAWSTDGVSWNFNGSFVAPGSPPKCREAGDASGCGGPYVSTLRRADGSVEALYDAERPRVWVNASTGLPSLLFYSSGGPDPTAKDGRARGITVVQRIRTAKLGRMHNGIM